MGFERIAPYLKDELVLVGFFLFLAFLLCRYLLVLKIIPPLGRTFGYRILQRLLLYGFVIGLALIVLGAFLKHQELSDNEQRRVLLLLRQELASNLRIHGELLKNVEVLVVSATRLADTLRIPGNTVMATMFPRDNVDSPNPKPPAEMARNAFSEVQQNGYYKDPTLRARFNSAARLMFESTRVTLPTIRSLTDREGSRYRFSRETWEANMPIYRKITLFPVTEFQTAYSLLDRERQNYGVACQHVDSYVTVLNDFFDPSRQITRERLAATLSAERNAFSIMTTYTKELVGLAESLKDLDRRVSTLAD